MAYDRFIPFSKYDIVNLCAKLRPEPESFKQFSHLLSSLIHHQYHAHLESLKYHYTPFDPNSDTRPIRHLTTQQKALHQREFAKEFALILNAANYERITAEDLQDALNEESLFKVRLAVEFDDFAEVVFYRRGESQKTETLTSWWGLRKKQLQFTNYDRVAVFIRFKDAEYFARKKTSSLAFEPSSTIVKLFQNVPKADLEMLFPNSEVKMRPIDKVVIASSALVGGAVVLVTKLGASILLLAALLSFWLGWRSEAVTMSQQHFITFAIGMGVFGSFIFKEWSKFKNRKIRFMKALSDNLYFKNLDNNAGVLHTLVDAAQEEDVKEALLAYTFLLNSPQGLSASQLDDEIETWFKQQHDCVLDFEISDALQKLTKMQLVNKQDEQFTAIPLPQAKVQLDKQWDDLFKYN
ncbi:TMEM143 family protein [Pseudoalteromonas shioyasakiensis]|uniref:TMEM143 family protein n=1 Tax=Pseudoalteromonas shioyasakiensis TaxID=1190813 RepID=UPI0021197232|nr:TMEM143 family protein [Pseudoalteromonas shioyasakiensis]MCQ8877983.1 TMEM143 family protein [Pseudoalteromonas shioyasakiensis]